MRKLRIDISGPRGSGKTTIAALIQQALVGHGIEVVNIDDSYVEKVMEDMEKGAVCQIWPMRVVVTSTKTEEWP